MVNQWVWYDPKLDETWVMERNPDEMTTPHPPKNSTIFSRSIGGLNSVGNGVSRVLQFRQRPFEWQFSGNVRSQAMHDTLLLWTARTNRLHITDHLERTWEVRITAPDIDEERQSARNAWRFRYTIKANMYGQVS